MIRVEAVWLCTEPMDMRAGTDTTLARVVKVFGAARPHHAYIFANRRSTRRRFSSMTALASGWRHGGCMKAASSGLAVAAERRSRSRVNNSMRWCSACRGSVWGRPGSSASCETAAPLRERDNQ